VTEHGAGPGWLPPSVAVPLDGSERFAGVDATVADFWRWAFSDLRDNATRGMFAEFLVAKAAGDQRLPPHVLTEPEDSGTLRSARVRGRHQLTDPSGSRPI
jgi:hypothetical protein